MNKEIIPQEKEWFDSDDIGITDQYNQTPDPDLQSKSTQQASQQDIDLIFDLSPLGRFNRIKNEIDSIERDMKVSEKYKNLFQNRNLSTVLHEIDVLRKNLRIIGQSLVKNPQRLDYLKSLNDQERIERLKKKVLSEVNSHILHKIEIINKIKSSNPELYKNVKMELFLAKDSNIGRVGSRFLNIKNSLKEIENKIKSKSQNDIKKSTNSISEVVAQFKVIFSLFSEDSQQDMKKNLENLSKKLSTLNEDNDDFYLNFLNRGKIDELIEMFGSSKEASETVLKSMEKLENQKNSHEVSAFIHLKLNDLLEQQNKIKERVTENEEILNTVNENMKENVTVMKKNLEILKERLSKLKK